MSDWTDDQLRRHAACLKGDAVLANFRTDAPLIEWAERNRRLVRIDRPSRWENPFKLCGNLDREKFVADFEDYLVRERPDLLDEILALQGKVLACWCHPKLCHGDVLIRRLRSRLTFDAIFGED